MYAPKYSVIVPAFNRENTIADCIASILNSNYDNIELIVVDDGSSDKTLAVCQTIAEKEPRLHVYTKTNGGVSTARNLGITKATGDYIIFIDSDDMLCPDAIKTIASVMDADTDLLIYPIGNTFAEQQHDISAPTGEKLDITRIVGNRELVEWIYTKYIPNFDNYFSVVNKVFRAKIIHENNIHFTTTVSLGEDQIFVCDYLKHARSLDFINYPLYYVLIWPRDLRADGLGTKLRSPEDFLHNQQQNYNALMELYAHCGVDCVREFAADYILDRMVTRILFRHLDKANKSSVSISEIEAFTAKKIKPLVDKERASISRQKKKVTRYILRLIASGHSGIATMLAYVYANAIYLVRVLRKKW